METKTVFEMIGGAETVRSLIEAFYPKVEAHPDLKDLFPKDIRPVMEKQYLFLTQFFGGPPLYNQTHGHPMLRARHMPFEINERRARAWLQCMAEALNEIGLAPEMRDQIWQRLAQTAAHMINRPS